LQSISLNKNQTLGQTSSWTRRNTCVHTNTSTPKPLNEQRDGNETNLRAEPQRNPSFQLPPSGAEEHDEVNQCHTHTNTHTH